MFEPERSHMGHRAMDLAVRLCGLRSRPRQGRAGIRDWLAERDIVLAGRYSEWEYYNSDHAFIAGRKAAEEVAARLAPAYPTSSVETLASLSPFSAI